MARARNQRGNTEIWPGFVDVLSTLLLVFIFLLVIFALVQYFLTQTLSGREEALVRLQRQVTELADLLSLERDTNTELRSDITQLSASLQASSSARDELVLKLSSMEERALSAERSLADATKTVQADKDTITAQLAEIGQLKRDITSLRDVRRKLEQDVGKLAAELEDRDALIGELRDRSKALEADLATERDRTLLTQKQLEERETRLAELQTLYFQTEDQLEKQKAAAQGANSQVDILNQQLLALRVQLARLENALEASETKDEESKTVIADLGRRLNLALASKVEELSRYRSEFFGRLREVLGGQKGIQVVGDRFVFQSEVLFESGQDELEAAGATQLEKLAETLLEISAKIPEGLNWVMRVDGHTDVRPIATARYPSNWELSSARAISVVKFLVSQGVPPERLIAAGMGQFHPLDGGGDEIAFRRNRRIELKLTQR